MSAPDAERPGVRLLWWWLNPGETVPNQPPIDVTDRVGVNGDCVCPWLETPVGPCVDECARVTFAQPEAEEADHD